MCYSKIYLFLSCIIFKQNVFNNRLFVYISPWCNSHGRHGAQIQSSIYLPASDSLSAMRVAGCSNPIIYISACIWLTFSRASGWILKSNHFLCIWLTFSHASGWVLKSNHFPCIWVLTHFQPCEWLGAQIQSFSVYLSSDSLSAMRVAGCSNPIIFCVSDSLSAMRVSGWVLKSNHFLCIWFTFGHASGWVLKSNHFLCIWLTFNHASEWLGAQIQ